MPRGSLAPPACPGNNRARRMHAGTVRAARSLEPHSSGQVFKTTDLRHVLFLTEVFGPVGRLPWAEADGRMAESDKKTWQPSRTDWQDPAAAGTRSGSRSWIQIASTPWDPLA
jgi:hypothetical protein